MKLNLSSIALILTASVAIPAAADETELPTTVSLEDVELTITSTSQGLLDENCDYGPHTETISISGTGHAELVFDILGAECPAEIHPFELPRDQVVEMVSTLLTLHFHKLAPEFHHQLSACNACAPNTPPGSLTVVTTITTHAPDITVRLRIGEFEHTVHYHNGATVPKLSDTIMRWFPMLWRKAGCLRHFPPDER